MSNLERMLALADEVFAIHEDPAQLQVDAAVLDRLQRIHPATRSEVVRGDGPVVWLLVIPTTTPLMEAFLQGILTEHELYERTPFDVPYDALYLCSVLVLPEFRRQGLAQQLTLGTITTISKDHPIRTLFCWPFTPEGEALATTLALAAGLPLRTRAH